MHWLKWKMSEVKEKGSLGFRYIHEFNLAVLAKQLWRILIHPNFLVSKVSKSKYFENLSIWKVKEKSNNSFLWKSLLSVRLVLQEGLQKRVGDGTNIDIWEDQWINRMGKGKIKTKNPQECPLQRVNELITEGWWNKELLAMKRRYIKNPTNPHKLPQKEGQMVLSLC